MHLTDWDIAIVVTALECLQRMEDRCKLDRGMSTRTLRKFRREFNRRLRDNDAALAAIEAAREAREHERTVA